MIKKNNAENPENHELHTLSHSHGLVPNDSWTGASLVSSTSSFFPLASVLCAPFGTADAIWTLFCLQPY